MKRRDFLIRGSVAASGLVMTNALGSYAANMLDAGSQFGDMPFYETFENPASPYKPFVRWWWNGNKIEKAELARELRVLKEAGIGGVEINPISFPSRTDDMGKPSIEYLSDAWIDLLKFALEEAKSLGMTCDLLVGTGFPMGGEFLEDEERTQIVVLAVKRFTGPLETELSLFDLYKEADPMIKNPYSGRTMEMLQVKLMPEPLDSLDQIVDLSDQIKTGKIKVTVPAGDYAVCALVKVQGFMQVIQGSPGGMGPVLNHFDGRAVKKYLNLMSETIQQRIGSLAPYVRSFFVDSMETEGANWSSDMRAEFQKRRGYDLYPYLPIVLVKIGGMGNTISHSYPVKTSAALKEMAARIRYDFELTKAELFNEHFVKNFSQWCKDNKIKSRAQAYGRGYFPLEGSFDLDIPECETWLKYGIGEDITENELTQYPWHLGRGYTMINKIVSSAAHLKDKRVVSSEELTNTEMVFNESLEIFKIGGDQSTMSGVTHPVFHGFNYSPPEAAFPGWITYGGYLNEKNTMWPYFKHYTTYRARLSALLQQSTMFADIAIMAPFADQWATLGAQNEPFPVAVSPAYQMLVWESIHQNGNACDYVSESVIKDSAMKKGYMTYGSRSYHTLILMEIRSMDPETAKQLHTFVANGGRIFCLAAYPEQSNGWYKHKEGDEEVMRFVAKMKSYPDRFIFLDKPAGNFINWYKDIQAKYNIAPYVKIETPKSAVMQVRYQRKDMEIFLFNNSSSKKSTALNAVFQKAVFQKKQAWIWDAVTGKRHKLDLKEGRLQLEMGPADLKVIVFEQHTLGTVWKPMPAVPVKALTVQGEWRVEFTHLNGTAIKDTFNPLKDLKDFPEHQSFSGEVTYRNSFNVSDKNMPLYMDLGRVHGICKLRINGKDAGTQWYGRRIYQIDGLVQEGLNELVIEVVTVMGNYMKTLEDNVVAQYWTNEKRKNQPIQSMGLIGPVTYF